MSKHAKFLFEDDFEAPPPPPPPTPEEIAAKEAEEERRRVVAAKPKPVTYSAQQLEEARKAGYAEGLTAGAEQTGAAIEARTANALTLIGGEMENFRAGLDSLEIEARRNALNLARIIAGKLAPGLLARLPAAEIEAVIEQCLEEHNLETRIIVHVPEQLLSRITSHLESLATAKGFPGQIIAVADQQLSGSDCRVEWTDGGVVRSLADVEKTVEEIIQHYIKTALPDRDDDSSPPGATDGGATDGGATDGGATDGGATDMEAEGMGEVS